MYTAKCAIFILLIIPMQPGFCSDKSSNDQSDSTELILILDAPISDSARLTVKNPISNLELVNYVEETQLLPQVPEAPETARPAKDPRINDLEKSITEIDVYQELKSDDNPVNAASNYLDLPPVNIWEGEWIKHAPNRYPISFCHLPLYYEELNLERCGQSYGCLQPVMSSAHFLKTTVCLPVEMIFDPPCELVRSRGDCLTCHKFTDSHH